MNGIVLVNKKAGQSSNAVVNKVKHILNVKKAGHLGTLDVLGEGLLPVTINKGTKVFEYFLSKDKVYYTIFKFGVETQTLDCEGEITMTDDKVVTPDDIQKILPEFIGKFDQLPPIYSAKKIDGQTAYKLAREGKEVNLKPKQIQIYDIKCLGRVEGNAFAFTVHCSAGTYIRSLARDFARALGTCGIMQYIQRTRCGMFNIEDSFTLEDIQNGKYNIISLDKLFPDLQEVHLSIDETQKLLNGVAVAIKRDGEFKLYCGDEFLGIGNADNGKIKFSLRLC